MDYSLMRTEVQSALPMERRNASVCISVYQAKAKQVKAKKAHQIYGASTCRNFFSSTRLPFQPLLGLFQYFQGIRHNVAERLQKYQARAHTEYTLILHIETSTSTSINLLPFYSQPICTVLCKRIATLSLPSSL